MKKVYEAPALEMIAFMQEDVLAGSVVINAGMIGNADAVLGSGTTGTTDSSVISGGVSLW